MDSKEIINKLIPADDLFWHEEDQDYKPISKEQLDEIILACVNQGIQNLDDICKVVNWVVSINTGSILIKNFIYGNIKITGFEQEEPLFGVQNEN